MYEVTFLLKKLLFFMFIILFTLHWNNVEREREKGEN